MTSQVKRGKPGTYHDGEPGIMFNNGGGSSFFVPGYGHPVPIELPSGQRFAHGYNDWAQNRLTAREIAILRLLNRITDRPHWYAEVDDPEMVGTWAAEAQQNRLISLASWEWCMKELRDKSEYYIKTSLTHAFDSSSRVCKSDEQVPADLLRKMSSEVETLASCDDGSLVSPDMFPLVYGRTRVLSRGGRVSLLNAVDSSGQGETSENQIWKCPRDSLLNCDGTSRMGANGNPNCNRCGRTDRCPDNSWEEHGSRFSADYQWLPCEVSVRREDACGDSRKIRVLSYINNLHPRRHVSLYGSIERCIEASIQPWNEVLVYRDKGRTPERIRTCGVQWSPLPPDPGDLEDLDNLMDQAEGQWYGMVETWLNRFIGQADNPRTPPPSRRYPSVDTDWRSKLRPSQALEAKYHRVKEWLHPEPGSAFSYEAWKRGENNRAVVPVFRQIGRNVVDRSPKDNHEFYTVSIEERFADQGLQVIIEIGSVELTPETSHQPASEWQLSGLANDHIVASTIIYFSSENMSPDSGSLTFRVEARLDPFLHIYGTNTGSSPFHPLSPLADIYDCTSRLELGGDEDIDSPGGRSLQILGTVTAPDGRLIAFPNVMQHRVEAFDLLDPSRPGHRKWLKLHLVDPHYRICSTRNVPPQQFDWWYEAGLGKIDWEARQMPTELVQEFEARVGDYPITAEEAETNKERIRIERAKKFNTVLENVPFYNFGDWAADGDVSRYRP